MKKLNIFLFILIVLSSFASASWVRPLSSSGSCVCEAYDDTDIWTAVNNRVINGTISVGGGGNSSEEMISVFYPILSTYANQSWVNDNDDKGYDSLSDLQSAVTNDFHNLGGVDLNTPQTPWESDIDANQYGVNNLEYFKGHIFNDYGEGEWDNTSFAFSEDGISLTYEESSEYAEFCLHQTGGMYCENNEDGQYYYQDKYSFTYKDSPVCTADNGVCPDIDTDTNVTSIQVTGTTTKTLNLQQDGKANLTASWTDETGAASGNVIITNWTSEQTNSTVTSPTKEIAGLYISLPASSTYLIYCQLLTMSSAVATGERLNVSIKGAPTQFEITWLKSVSATTMTTFRGSSTTQNLLANTGSGAVNGTHPSFLQGFVKTSATPTNITYGLYSETAATYVAVMPYSWCKYEKVI